MARPELYVLMKLKEKDVTVVEIARRSGEDFRTVSHVIRGRRSNRSLPVFLEIAKAIGVPLGYLQEMYSTEKCA
jgi:transcriptional regulator with XRE-family HTH domain